jgi:hypothetical protein
MIFSTQIQGVTDLLRPYIIQPSLVCYLVQGTDIISGPLPHHLACSVHTHTHTHTHTTPLCATKFHPFHTLRPDRPASLLMYQIGLDEPVTRLQLEQWTNNILCDSSFHIRHNMQYELEWRIVWWRRCRMGVTALHILQVLGSNLGPETGYWKSSDFLPFYKPPFLPPRKCRDGISIEATVTFFHIRYIPLLNNNC